MSMKVVLGDYLIERGWRADQERDKHGDWPAACSFYKPVLGGFSPQKAYNMDRQKQRYIVYDLETRKMFPKRNETIIPEAQYCEGWEDYGGCGIAVLAAYVSVIDRSVVFLRDNLPEFQDLLNETDCVVGFNTVRFDNNVVSHTNLEADPEKPARYIHFPDGIKQYDIAREIWKADGLDPNKWQPNTHGGVSLDACLDVNFGIRKTGNSALTPLLWQQGKYGEVITKCVADAEQTAMLFHKILKDGYLYHPKYPGQTVTLPRPFDVNNAKEERFIL